MSKSKLLEDNPAMKSNLRSTLDELIRSINLPNRELPLALPPTHLSKAENFKKILDDDALMPLSFMLGGEKQLLYLFYGGIFYRYSPNKNTRNPDLAPIAFVFKPSILSKVYRYYPFDTGLLKRTRFQRNKIIKSLKTEFYEVNPADDLATPRKMIYTIFGTNNDYLNGKPLQNKDSGPIPVLGELESLYKNAPAKLRADWRIWSIECQFDKEISLKDLEWIGFPNVLEKDTIDYRISYTEKYGPTLPEFYAYPFRETFYPNELAYHLEEEAQKRVIKNYLY
jgi:hypothetical protein